MYSPEFEVNGSSKPVTGRCKPEAGSNLKAQVRSRVRSLRRQLAGTEKERMDEQIRRAFERIGAQQQIIGMQA